MVEAAPHDPIERLRWINDQRNRLDGMMQRALFDARLQGRFEDAIVVSGLSRKRATAMTRHENEARGRMIRWTTPRR